MMVFVAGLGLCGGFEESSVGNPQDGNADENGDEVSHAESGSDDEVGIIEGLKGADRGDGIENGSRQHVGEGAGDGEAVFDEASDDWHDSAFADGENGAEETARHDGEDGVFRENLLEGVAREVGSEESADEGAKEDKRKALEEDREKFV